MSNSIIIIGIGLYLIVAAISAGMRFWIWRADRKLKAFRDCHHTVLTAISVYHLPEQTVVLKRCPICGIHIAPVLPGRWSLQDFINKEPDVSQFEKMLQK